MKESQRNASAAPRSMPEVLGQNGRVREERLALCLLFLSLYNYILHRKHLNIVKPLSWSMRLDHTSGVSLSNMSAKHILIIHFHSFINGQKT